MEDFVGDMNQFSEAGCFDPQVEVDGRVTGKRRMGFATVIPIDPNHVAAALEQGFPQAAANESRVAGDKYFTVVRGRVHFLLRVGFNNFGLIANGIAWVQDNFVTRLYSGGDH